MKEYIQSKGWIFQEDRGMSDNYGFLFTKGDLKLQYWTVFPRIAIYKDGRNIRDTNIVTNEKLKTFMDNE